MAGTPIRRERRERAAKLLEDPTTFAGILERVSAGLTLATASQPWDIPHHIIRTWIEADESRVAEYEKAKGAREQVLRDMVSGTLAELCETDVTEAFREDGSLKPLSEIPAHVRATIAGIESQEIFEGTGDNKRVVGVVRKLRFWDRLKALELTARSLRMLTDRNELELSRQPTLAELLSQDPPPRTLPKALPE